jgi:c-di-AMP phosphodiesterase-like protein
MMVVLTKAELSWVRNLLLRQISDLTSYLESSENQISNVERALGALTVDNYKSVEDKLSYILATGAKRIAIR